VHVIVEFRSHKCPASESKGMEFTVVSKNGENAHDSVVGCVRPNHNLMAGNPVIENRSSCKYIFKSVKGRLTSGQPIPPFAGMSEASVER
jgi:hypothetical protein